MSTHTFLRKLPLCTSVVLLLAAVCYAGGSVQAQQPLNLSPDLDPAIAEKVRNIALLPAEFRREPLQQLIEDYPNTDIARWARQLLDVYDRQAALREQERQADLERTRRIRAYWDSRRPAPMMLLTDRLTITNASRDLLSYEIKYHDSKWLGPYVLLPGRTRELGRTVQFRELSGKQLQQSVLVQGHHYEFRPAENGTGPTMIEVSR